MMPSISIIIHYYSIVSLSSSAGHDKPYLSVKEELHSSHLWWNLEGACKTNGSFANQLTMVFKGAPRYELRTINKTTISSELSDKEPDGDFELDFSRSTESDSLSSSSV